MRVIARTRAVMLLAVFSVAAFGACSGTKTARPPVSAPAGTTAPVASTAPGRWHIPVLPVRPLADSPHKLGKLDTDGTRLFAALGTTGSVRSSLVRLDPGSGRVVASYRNRVPTTPVYAPGSEYVVTGSAIVLLDGDRPDATVLDPDSMRIRKRIPLPPDARSDVPPDGRVFGPVWIGHRRYANDQLAGRATRIGMSRLDLDRGVVAQTRPVPTCGTKGAVQPTARFVVYAIECSYEIGVTDLVTGETKTFPGFQSRPEVALLDGEVWVRWPYLGYVARFDWRQGRFTYLDAGAEGPILSMLYGLRFASGSVWAMGIPAEPGHSRLLVRIDPERVAITARVWTGDAVIVGGAGRALDALGRLSAFDLDAVRGGAPQRVVRPTAPGATRREARPRNAEEQAVIASFRRVFDPTVDNETASPWLEHGTTLLPIRSKLLVLAKGVFPGARLLATSVAVSGADASVSYVYEFHGAPAFVPLNATLHRVDGHWLVTKESVCRLAELAALATC